MPTYDVSAIGLYILDILGRPIEAIPPGGRAFYIDEINLAVAGTGGGTAVACGILGLRTQAVTAIGDDASGEFMLANMQRHGLDVGLVRRLPGVATSATMLPVRPNGERPAWH
ncbi:MAG: carbohydrate kinase family protein, partial [Geminicoccaceae bacterium]